MHDSIVTAYSLARLAAEKLRAYLERLPEHQTKIGASSTTFRVKDLYDIAAVVESRPLADVRFWEDVASEFVVACESRLVDCAGMITFAQSIDAAAVTFRNDATIPADRSFESVWEALSAVIGRLESLRAIPIRFPR